MKINVTLDLTDEQLQNHASSARIYYGYQPAKGKSKKELIAAAKAGIKFLLEEATPYAGVQYNLHAVGETPKEKT